MVSLKCKAFLSCKVSKIAEVQLLYPRIRADVQDLETLNAYPMQYPLVE